MKENQNNLCKICQIDGSQTFRGKLVIDHCHKTGKVRGLLCDACNKGLGCFRDKYDRLLLAVQYLMEDPM